MTDSRHSLAAAECMCRNWTEQGLISFSPSLMNYPYFLWALLSPSNNHHSREQGSLSPHHGFTVLDLRLNMLNWLDEFLLRPDSLKDSYYCCWNISFLRKDLRGVLDGKLHQLFQELDCNWYCNLSEKCQRRHHHWKEDSFCEYHHLELHNHCLRFRRDVVRLDRV